MSETTPVQPPTLYDQLGVPDDADAAMIKAAFRKLMRTYHPDVYGPEGEAISKDLGAAYAVLSDPQARERYDRELAGEDEAADAGPSWVDEDEAGFEDAWGEEAQWEAPPEEPEAPEEPEDTQDPEPAPRVDPYPAPAERPRPRPEPKPTEPTERESTWPLTQYPKIVPRHPAAMVRKWAAAAGVGVALCLVWALIAQAPSQLEELPRRAGLVGAAVVVGALAAYILARPAASKSKRSKKPSRQPDPDPVPAKTTHALVVLVAGIAAILLFTPSGAWVFGAAGIAAVITAVCGFVYLRAVAVQKHLDQYMKWPTLRDNNLIGPAPGGAVEDLVRRDVERLLDIPQLRMFRNATPGLPFRYALLVGDRVALVRGLMARPGDYRWSGPSLLRDVPGEPYPEEVLTGDYAKALRDFQAGMGPRITVESWLIVYPVPAGGEIRSQRAQGFPTVSTAATAVQSIGDFLVGGDRREVVDQKAAVDVLKTMVRSGH